MDVIGIVVMIFAGKVNGFVGIRLRSMGQCIVPKDKGVMMRTKEEKIARKEGKVQEWIGVFKREYEMARAYGETIEKALWKGQDGVNSAMRKDRKAVPQDGMFFLDCKIILQSRLKDVVMDHERPVAHV